MGIDLYYMLLSPPCRNVMLVAKALGIKLNLKYIDLDKEEHLTPQFLKLNLKHTLPTMDDNGYVLVESRAIMTYLINQYGKPDDPLYPKDPKKRGKVDQILYFDATNLYRRYADYYFAPFYGIASDPENMKKLEESFGFLDKFLENDQWVAGSNLTVADIATTVTIADAEVMGFKLDPKKYPNVVRYFKNSKAAIVGYNEINVPGIKEHKIALDEAKARHNLN